MATNAERLRSAYSRATWPALIVGTVVGAVLGLMVVQIVGSAAPWGVALTFGVAGVVTAAIAAGLSLAVLAGMNTYVSPSPHVRVAAATLTASVATAMVSLALLWMLFLRGVLWIAALAGVVAAIVALGLALAAEWRAPTLPQPARRDHIPSGIGLWPLGAAMLIPIGGASSIFLLRAQLHVQCGIHFEVAVSQVEANGSWVCADGISYLIPGIILSCGPFVFAVVGAGIAASGFAAINWTTISTIAASWVLSPVLGGLVGAGIMAFINSRVVYTPDRLKAARYWLPILLGLMGATFTGYILLKTSDRLIAVPEWLAIVLSLTVGFVVWRIYCRVIHAQTLTLENSARALRDAVLMAASDGSVDDEELEVLKEIAEHLGLVPDAVQQLIEWTKTGYSWMQDGYDLLNSLQG